VRYHLCWGSWLGSRTHELPLEHIIEVILEVKAQTSSFEARQCAARARMW